jgi:hypothetical protein
VCLGSCIYIKFEGRKGKESGRCYVFFESLYCFSRSVLIERETLNIGADLSMQQ